MSFRHSLSLLILAAAFAGPAVANDTPAAQRTIAWIAAFNSNSDDAMKKFVESSFAPAVVAKHGADKIATQYQGARKQLGKLKLESLVTQGDSAVALVLAEGVGIRMEVTGNVDKDAPNHLTGVGIKAAK